eukprot:TRINITY_DN3669_c0_g1_i1.p1 TRINITY_DN3669_c0_g1~~TRINITY_DN3669_c0_g1_i1.p1  ORF type:complete len:167 (-),score=25.10 TRINITY_DN3669_c0_g1_i1:648-1148(-)
MIGNLDDNELGILRSHLSERETGSLGERRCAFFALGILLNTVEGRCAKKMRSVLLTVGGGGRGAKLIRNFVLNTSKINDGECAQLLNWYCKGDNTWISELAVEGSGDKKEGWFVRMGKEEEPDDSDEQNSEEFDYECNTEDDKDGSSSSSERDFDDEDQDPLSYGE